MTRYRWLPILVLAGCAYSEPPRPPSAPGASVPQAVPKVPAPEPPAKSEPKSDGPGLTGIVTRVSDAQTLLIQTPAARKSLAVRLIGLEAPRKATRDKDGQEPWGTRAQQFLSVMATRQDVRVEFDVLQPADDGAKWGYVWVGDKLLNEEILREGHGVLDTRPPNVRYVERLTAAQRHARENRLGIWNPQEPLPEPPSKFVATQKQATENQKEVQAELALREFTPGCIIGNSKSKVYHLPTGRNYETAKASAHAVYFRTAEDAEKAGYKAASK